MHSFTLQFVEHALINKTECMFLIMDLVMLCPDVLQPCQHKFVAIYRAILRQWEMKNPAHGPVKSVEQNEIKSTTFQIEKENSEGQKHDV